MARRRTARAMGKRYTEHGMPHRSALFQTADFNRAHSDMIEEAACAAEDVHEVARQVRNLGHGTCGGVEQHARRARRRRQTSALAGKRRTTPISSTPQSGATGTTTGQSTPNSGGASPSPTLLPTLTPSASPSIAPSPPPSPTPLNGQVDLHGGVFSVNQSGSSFVLQHSGVMTTIIVSQTTQWSGTATSLAQLQVGWHAEVIGQASAGVVTATSVNANPVTDT